MANTLTGLIPVLYKGLDIVRRELVGLIPAVSIDAKAKEAAVGQTIRTPISPDATAGDITAGQLPADDGDQTIGYLDMTITKSRYSPIRWTGEELLGFKTNGESEMILANQFAQSLRKLVNEVELDLANLYASASRAYGTAGTTPFASDLSDPANMLKLLLDNGAPQVGDKQLIIDTAAGAKLRSLANVTRASEAGSDTFRKSGLLMDIDGFMIRESAAVKSVTKGTGAAYTTNTAGYAVGATAITLITGTGTVLAGDVVTFAGDTNKYVVAAGVAAPGVITLAAPGLLQAIPASATAMTIGNNFRASMAFERDAIKLLARTPAMPEEGDMADDVYNLTDPISGLTFQVARYKLYRRVKYEVGLAWGVKAIKPEFLHLLLG